jgi:hypothetical protein
VYSVRLYISMQRTRCSPNWSQYYLHWRILSWRSYIHSTKLQIWPDSSKGT